MIAGRSTVGAWRAGSARLLADFAVAEAYWLNHAVAGLPLGAGWLSRWVGILEFACAPGAVHRRLGGRSVPKVA
jgi:hypothetical protein